MVNCEDIKIGIVWASNTIQKYDRFEEDGFVYYLLPQKPLPVVGMNKLGRILARIYSIFNTLKPYSYDQELKDSVQVVKDFNPDVVHVWGTENFYGLICNLINIPVLIRFQGLISVLKDDYWGGVKFWKRFNMPKEFLQWLISMRLSARKLSVGRAGLIMPN